MSDVSLPREHLHDQPDRGGEQRHGGIEQARAGCDGTWSPIGGYTSNTPPRTERYGPIALTGTSLRPSLTTQ